MSDYNCPECSCGFCEKAGRFRISEPWYDEDAKWWQNWTLRLMDSMFLRTYYGIACPNCGHVLIGDEYVDE